MLSPAILAMDAACCAASMVEILAWSASIEWWVKLYR